MQIGFKIKNFMSVKSLCCELTAWTTRFGRVDLGRAVDGLCDEG